MPHKNNDLSIDDDDILDLSVVAKSPAQTQPPASLGDNGFGADLDALLEDVHVGASGTGMAPSAPIAAPIADQSPTGRPVDPHEELGTPETTDIDSLLKEFGAQPAPAPEATRTVIMQETLVAAAAPMPEFNGILAQAQAAQEAKDTMPQEPAAPTATPEAEDSLDLNELDALLDDILSTAPPSDQQPAAPAPVQQVDAAVGDGVIPVPDQAILPSQEISVLAERIQRLESALEALDAVAPVAERVGRMEKAVEELRAAQQPVLTETAIVALVQSALTELVQPGSGFLEAVTESVSGQLPARMEEMLASPNFRQNLEKMTAAAAAKVIREEIAALIVEGS